MGFLRCCVYYAALGVASFFVGRLLPKSWFHADRFPYRCAPWEAKLYRALRVHAWQDKVPDMSRIVPKLIPAKKLGTDFRAQLPRMIEETCVAEFTHFALILLGFMPAKIAWFRALSTFVMLPLHIFLIYMLTRASEKYLPFLVSPDGTVSHERA